MPRCGPCLAVSQRKVDMDATLPLNMKTSVPKEITDIVNGSGNTFHAKVTRWFAAAGWHVVISPYYMDQAQGKAREIDLVAEKIWPVKDEWRRPQVDGIAIRLIIECKFVAAPAVFWFAPKDMDAAERIVCSDGIFDKLYSQTLSHHYLAKGPVAKIFASKFNKEGENEPFYKALNQSLNAMVSMRRQPLRHPNFRNPGRSPTVRIIELPVVVCSSFVDKIFAVDFYGEPSPQPIHENFQLEVQYAYIDRDAGQRNDDFLLDFVAFDNLENFGATLDRTALAAVEIAKFRTNEDA
jgi:hypothetical protein